MTVKILAFYFSQIIPFTNVFLAIHCLLHNFQWVIAYFALFLMVYWIFCIVLQWFIAYFALFCNGLLHILHCFAMVYCTFCIVFQCFIAYFAIVLQWFIAYFALQVVAGVMQREEVWLIWDADGVKAATALLPFTQPGEELYVELFHSTPTQALHQLAATIKQTAFGGQLVMSLNHSHDNFIPCDDLVKDFGKELHGAK